MIPVTCYWSLSLIVRGEEEIMLVFEPFFRGLTEVPLRNDIPETVKSTSARLLNAFVNLVFEFIDQPLLPSQAEELRKALRAKNVSAKVYVCMRYWHPFTEEAIEQVDLLRFKKQLSNARIIVH